MPSIIDRIRNVADNLHTSSCTYAILNRYYRPHEIIDNRDLNHWADQVSRHFIAGMFLSKEIEQIIRTFAQLGIKISDYHPFNLVQLSDNKSINLDLPLPTSKTELTLAIQHIQQELFARLDGISFKELKEVEQKLIIHDSNLYQQNERFIRDIDHAALDNNLISITRYLISMRNLKSGTSNPS